MNNDIVTVQVLHTELFHLKSDLRNVLCRYLLCSKNIKKSMCVHIPQ